jgi:hypothetical protein
VPIVAYSRRGVNRKGMVFIEKIIKRAYRSADWDKDGMVEG